MSKNNILIVGAGISGIALAERYANALNKKVTILEKRNHIAGNCFDYSYITTIFYSLAGFLFIKKNFFKYIKQNKYILEEINAGDIPDQYKKNLSNASNRINLFVMPKYCYIKSIYLKKKLYYKLTRTKQTL